MSTSPAGANPEQYQSVPLENAQMFDAPVFNGADIKLFKNGNDVTLLLSRAHPGVAVVNGQETVVVNMQALCIWNLSIQTLKDMSLILSATVAEIEKDTGEIVTDFSRRSGNPSA